MTSHEPYVLLTNISDHMPRLTCINKRSKKRNSANLVEYRMLKNKNIDMLSARSSDVNWDYSPGSNCDDAFNDFHTKLCNLFHECCPVKRKVISERNDRTKAPCMTAGLLKCSRKYDKLYKLSIGLNPTSKQVIDYKRYRNKLNQIKIAAKSIHVKSFAKFQPTYSTFCNID